MYVCVTEVRFVSLRLFSFEVTYSESRGGSYVS